MEYELVDQIDEKTLLARLDKVCWGIKPSRIKTHVAYDGYRSPLKNEAYPLKKCQKVWVNNAFSGQRYAIQTKIEQYKEMRQVILDKHKLDILTFKGAVKIKGVDGRYLTVTPILAEFNSTENKIVLIDGTHRFMASRSLGIKPNIMCFFGLELYRSVPIDAAKVVIYATSEDYHLALFFFGYEVKKTRINGYDFLNLDIFGLNDLNGGGDLVK